MGTVTAPAPMAGDCTALLEDFINAQPFATTIMFPPGAVYDCEQNVRVQSKVGLILEQIPLTRVGHHQREPGGHEDNVRVEHLTIQSCLGVTVRAWIVGPKRPETGYTNAQEGQAAIGIHGSGSIIVEHSDLSHVHGDFIYLGSRGQTPCKNITINDNVGLDAGRHAICVTACEGAEIHRNVMTGFHRHGYHEEKSRKGDHWFGINRSDNTFVPAA